MLSIIVAIAENNLIGGDNKLLWHLSEDLKRFKEITMDNTIIMGRKTFESLPGILPGRKHIVITRDEKYNTTFPYCSKLYLTKVKRGFSGDTYFPDIDFSKWKITYSSGEKKDPKNGIEFEYINLDRQ